MDIGKVLSESVFVQMDNLVRDLNILARDLMPDLLRIKTFNLIGLSVGDAVDNSIYESVNDSLEDSLYNIIRYSGQT